MDGSQIDIEDLPGVKQHGLKDSAMLGGSGYERNERDLYPTEEAVTNALARKLIQHGYLDSSATIWEPACGMGHMVRVLNKHFAKVIASDIVPLCDDSFQADFYSATPKEKFDAIITNPPYSGEIDKFIMRGLTHLRRGNCKVVAYVARHELDSAVTRHIYTGMCPEYAGKLTLLWRPRWVEGSTGSPRHNYAVYIWASRDVVAAQGGQRLFYVERG